MKVVHTLNLLCSLLGGLLVGPAAAGSDFSKSCDEIVVSEDGSSVQAKCFPRVPMAPPWICTKLDLNKCLGSMAGRIIAKNNGNFQSICESCGEADSLVIGCQCWTGLNYPDGSRIYYYSEYDLDNVVGNSNGYLTCFDHVGSRAGCY